MSWSPKLVDLTRPMVRETIIELAGKLVATPNPYDRVDVTYLRNWDTDNGALCQWTLPDHFGTHLDAPIHIVEHGQSVDKVELDRLIGDAVVLDLSFANGRGITAGDFERVRPRPKAGEIVLIWTNEPPATLDEFVVQQTYVTPEGARWLVAQGIKSVGVEAFSFEHLYNGLFVENYYSKDYRGVPWPAHRVCLERNVYIVEGLGNLDRLLGKHVKFSALPLPVPDSSGSPVRAVAWEDE